MRRTRQSHAPPPARLGYTVSEFCTAVGISISFYYELQAAGRGPRVMQGLGARKIISVAEAERWCRERTASSDADPQEAA
jgi:hypothetical protein